MIHYAGSGMLQMLTNDYYLGFLFTYQSPRNISFPRQTKSTQRQFQDTSNPIFDLKLKFYYANQPRRFQKWHQLYCKSRNKKVLLVKSRIFEKMWILVIQLFCMKIYTKSNSIFGIHRVDLHNRISISDQNLDWKCPKIVSKSTWSNAK